MKSSINESAHNKQDLHLFEYLEGELSESQNREIAAKLASDPDLQLELESWEASFVEADFYDTTALEKSLLEIPAKPWYAQSAVYVSVLVLAISFFSFLPLNKREADFRSAGKWTDDTDFEIWKAAPTIIQPVKKKTSEAGREESGFFPEGDATFRSVRTQPEESGEQPPEQELKPSQLGSSGPWSVSPQTTPKVPGSTKESNTSVERPLVEVSSIRPFITNSIPDPPGPEIVPKRQKLKFINKPSISRKEQRRIRRMKEKALQERKAREFMKGDRPYVVPLNTQNF